MRRGARRMFSDSELRKIVTSKIKEDEVLGQRVGGSGHLGYIHFAVDEIRKPTKVQVGDVQGWEITYVYTVIVEIEFTYYPHHPPYEYRNAKTIVVDGEGNVIVESQKKAVKRNRELAAQFTETQPLSDF